MVRTQGRPLATGLIEPRNALVFACVLEAAAFAVRTEVAGNTA